MRRGLKILNSVGVMLAKEKKQDGMMLAKVKEHACKSKSPKYPYSQWLNCCQLLFTTVSFYNRQLLHQTMSSFSIQAADVVILGTLSYASTVLSLVRAVIRIDHLDVMSHNEFLFGGNFSFLSRTVVSMVSFKCYRIVVFSTTCEHVLVCSCCRM